MYAGIVALKYADASSLGAYTLLRLVIALIAAVVVFHEPPAIESVVGAGLILASCLLSLDGAPERIRRLFPHLPPAKCLRTGFGVPTQQPRLSCCTPKRP
jgi:hypothetical protein